MNLIDIRPEMSQHTAPQALRTRTMAQQCAMDFVRQYFTRARGRSARQWLVYNQETGGGLLLVIGALHPRKKRFQGLSAVLGVAEVPPREELRAALTSSGPEGLRFDGARVALAGH